MAMAIELKINTGRSLVIRLFQESLKSCFIGGKTGWAGWVENSICDSLYSSLGFQVNKYLIFKRRVCDDNLSIEMDNSAFQTPVNRKIDDINRKLVPFSVLLSFLTKLFLAVILLVGVFASFAAYSNWIEKSGVITVSGEASKKVKPDLVKMKISFSNTANSSTQVLTGNESLAKSLVNIVTAQGVAKEDISIFNASLTPIQSGDNLTFRANNDAEIRIYDVTKYKNILNSLFSSQFSNISGVSFTLKDSKPTETELTDMAVKDAQAKASALAKASGRRLGRLLSVTVSELGGVDKTIGTSSENDVSAPAEIEIKKTATLVYEIK